MIAALIHSMAPCRGPRVARRHFVLARVSGASQEDLIQIGGSTIQGSGTMALVDETEFVEVEHLEASGNPVNVELY